MIDTADGNDLEIASGRPRISLSDDFKPHDIAQIEQKTHIESVNLRYWVVALSVRGAKSIHVLARARVLNEPGNIRQSVRIMCHKWSSTRECIARRPDAL
jgi:hypothetical protein